METAFREGEVKTVGTDIDKIMPPVSRFGGGGRAKKKQTVTQKLKTFFDKYFGIGSSRYVAEPDNVYQYDFRPETANMVAEPKSGYGGKKEDGNRNSE